MRPRGAPSHLPYLRGPGADSNTWSTTWAPPPARPQGPARRTRGAEQGQGGRGSERPRPWPSRAYTYIYIYMHIHRERQTYIFIFFTESL